MREYLRTRPAAQIERLRRRVAEGRIEVTGMFFNMSELPGESLYADSLQPLGLLEKRGMKVTTAMQNDVKITVQLGLPRAFYEGQKGGNGTRNVTDAQIVAILKGMFTATMGGYGGFKNRLDGAGHLSRVQFCSYFGQRPTGQLTLPHVDDASLQRVLKSMEKDETTRKWRRG